MKKVILIYTALLGLLMCMNEAADWKNIVGLVIFGVCCYIGKESTDEKI